MNRLDTDDHTPTLETGADGLPRLVWRFTRPRLAIASSVVGGGVGLRRWVLAAQVAGDDALPDPAGRLRAAARHAGCRGDGVGFLTAAPVAARTAASSGDVHAVATVGLRDPTWAASPEPPGPAAGAGTINLVAFLPVRCVDAALVNAVVTVTEAKTQALVEAGVPGSGTPTDAVCVLVPPRGRAATYAGPRSPLGVHLARAVHAAVAAAIPADVTSPRPVR